MIELDLAVSTLQEALFSLNRKLSADRRTDNNPIQGIKNTFGSLKDELFSDDYWEEDDPWDNPSRSSGRRSSMGRGDLDPWDDEFYR